MASEAIGRLRVPPDLNKPGLGEIPGEWDLVFVTRPNFICQCRPTIHAFSSSPILIQLEIFGFTSSFKSCDRDTVYIRIGGFVAEMKMRMMKDGPERVS